MGDIIEGHALVVGNGIEGKSMGLITRERHTTEGIEKSVIDFVIMSSDLARHIEYVHIDDKRINVLTKLGKQKKGKRSIKR